MAKTHGSCFEQLEKLNNDLKIWEQGFIIEFGFKPTVQDIFSRPLIECIYLYSNRFSCLTVHLPASRYRTLQCLKLSLKTKKNSSLLDQSMIELKVEDKFSEFQEIIHTPPSSSNSHLSLSPPSPSSAIEFPSLFEANSSFLSYFGDVGLEENIPCRSPPLNKTDSLSDLNPVGHVRDETTTPRFDSVGLEERLAVPLNHENEVLRPFNLKALAQVKMPCDASISIGQEWNSSEETIRDMDSSPNKNHNFSFISIKSHSGESPLIVQDISYGAIGYGNMIMDNSVGDHGKGQEENSLSCLKKSLSHSVDCMEEQWHDVSRSELLPNSHAIETLSNNSSCAAISLAKQIKTAISLDLTDESHTLPNPLDFDDTPLDDIPDTSDIKKLNSNQKRQSTMDPNQVLNTDFDSSVEVNSRPRKKYKSDISPSLSHLDSTNSLNSSMTASGKRRNFIRLSLKHGYKQGKSNTISSNKTGFRKSKFPTSDRTPYAYPPEDNPFSTSNWDQSEQGISNSSSFIEQLQSAPNSLDPIASSQVQKICQEVRSSIEKDSYLSDVMTRCLHQLLRLVTRFEVFRPGQELSITQILLGHSTLVILPTGSGKSLCYQLATYFYATGITLIISPLISLMIDQIKNLLPGLNGISLGSHLTQLETEAALEKVAQKKIQLLFISPEKLASSSFVQFCQENQIKINLCCVDEAHCISTWSHNFRPDYLSIHDHVVNQLKCPCILAMTATATRKTEKMICKHLAINSHYVLRFSPLGKHLSLSMTRTNDPHQTLEVILNRQEIRSSSIIIYVLFQNVADQLSNYLIQKGWPAGSYHAGKTPAERQKIQTMFCANHIQILVATVAFGMGLNKPDVRAVIHFSLPKSVENYVQEVGRAGRDQEPAFCYLIYYQSDVKKLRSLSYVNGIDRFQVKQLILYLWPFHKTKSKPLSTYSIHGRYVALKVDECEKIFDMRSPMIETILTCLESEGKLQRLRPLSITCELNFFNQSIDVLKIQSKILSQAAQCGKKNKGALIFSLDTLANVRDEFIATTLSALDQIEKHHGLGVKRKDYSFLVEILEELDGDVVDDCIDMTMNKIRTINQNSLEKLEAMDQLVGMATNPMRVIHGGQDMSAAIHEAIHYYFLKEDLEEGFAGQSLQTYPIQNSIDNHGLGKSDTCDYSHINVIQDDVGSFLSGFGDFVKSGRQVARIMHGIGSPQFPKEEWQKNPFWAKSADFDFELVMKIAQEKLIEIRTR